MFNDLYFIPLLLLAFAFAIINLILMMNKKTSIWEIFLFLSLSCLSLSFIFNMAGFNATTKNGETVISGNFQNFLIIYSLVFTGIIFMNVIVLIFGMKTKYNNFKANNKNKKLLNKIDEEKANEEEKNKQLEIVEENSVNAKID